MAAYREQYQVVMPAKRSRQKSSGKDRGTSAKDAQARVRTLLAACLALLEPTRTAAEQPAPLPPTADLKDFTERELEFLRLVRHPDSWPYTYIAVRMAMKLPTLHYLRRKLFEKLGVNSRTALALKVRDWALG